MAGIACVAALATATGACSNRADDQPATAAVGSPPTTTTPATSPSTAPATQPTAALTVTIADLRNRKGRLLFGVFRSAEGFPSTEKNAVYWEVRDASAESLTFTAALPPGRYAASVLHDENKNGDMDKNLIGIPKEGYGVTNNPKPKTRAATFQEATIELPAEGAARTISVQYF